MKKRLLLLLLSLTIVFPLLTAPGIMAASVNDYPVVFTTFNTAAVRNDPDSYPKFTVSGGSDLLVQSVTTYHWNDGLGSAPGTISIYEPSGRILECIRTQRFCRKSVLGRFPEHRPESREDVFHRRLRAADLELQQPVRERRICGGPRYGIRHSDKAAVRHQRYRQRSRSTVDGRRPLYQFRQPDDGSPSRRG